MNKKIQNNLVAAILLVITLIVALILKQDIEIVLMFYAGIFLGVNW